MKSSDAVIKAEEYDNALAEMEDYYGMSMSMQSVSESDIPQPVGCNDEEWDAMREAFLGQAIEAEYIIINAALTLEALLRAAERFVAYAERSDCPSDFYDEGMVHVMEFKKILDHARRSS